jgi:hypothetical protein
MASVAVQNFLGRVIEVAKAIGLDAVLSAGKVLD